MSAGTQPKKVLPILCLRLFFDQGHTAMHTPQIGNPISGRLLCLIHSRSLQREKFRTSSRPGGISSNFRPFIAFTGQVSLHILHFPHICFPWGLSTVRGMSVIREACLNDDPNLGFIIKRFLPNQPSPAALATALLGRVEDVNGSQSNVCRSVFWKKSGVIFCAMSPASVEDI